MSNDSQLQLDKFLPYRTVRLATKLSEAFSSVYKGQFDLAIAQWRIIAMLGEREALSAQDIAKLTAMDKVKVSRAVKELVAKKLIAKRQCEGDKRAFILTLTEHGEKLYQKIAGLALNWQARLLDCLSTDELSTFMSVIERLERSLDDTESR